MIMIKFPTSLRLLTAFTYAGLTAFAHEEESAPGAKQTEAAAVSATAAHAHDMLTRMCDDFGGRLSGSTANEAALNRLADELRALGLEPQRQEFSMPGWERGVDRVTMTAPFDRTLRAAAMGYSPATAPVSGRLVSIGRGDESDWPEGDLSGAIGLVASGSRGSTGQLAQHAADRGFAALLMINREAGGQLLMRTGSYSGEGLPVPTFTITVEEGRWIERLLARGTEVIVEVESTSRPREMKSANLVVTLPGKSPERVIVGAHFDSWDLGQGAIDNGLGIAQVFALAAELRGRELARTVELVWFNGEEQALWGSRHAATALGDAPVVAMVNLDMVGVPIAVNALGFDSLVPALERWNNARGGQKLPQGVLNSNWLGSDHVPYQLVGVPTVTFHAPIPRESVRYYHDFADTMDKLSVSLLAESSAVITDLVEALANDTSLEPRRSSDEEIKAFFIRDGHDERLQRMGWWKFD